MEDNFTKIHKLFLEKKYSELIFFIQSSLKAKPAKILNLLGVSRILRDGRKNQQSLTTALSEFKLAYQKDKKSNIGIEALSNFINATVDLYELEGLETNKNFSNNFDECITMFKECENNFGYNKKLVSTIIRVYKRINDLENTLFYLKTLVDNSDYNWKTLAHYVFFNYYKRNWRQEDYLYYSKKLNKLIKKYSETQLKPLLLQKKDKIKVGFLSSDLKKKHSVTYFLETVLLNYNRDKFDLILYIDSKIEDETTDKLKKIVKNSKNVSSLNDLEVINLIRSDGIDIIIDLMGITSERVAVFNNRVAKKQISWLGCNNTTGLDEMDYLIADRNLIYKDEEHLYSEKIIYLPDIWNCHPGFSFERLEIPPPFLKNNFITFGSFNNFNKVNDEVVNLWSIILKNVSNSKLILKSSTKREIERLNKIFEKNQVSDSVIYLNTVKSFEEHLNLYKKIDLALDPFPYTGITTSFEALWMGVPVLTMAGYNFHSRCGESINKNLNLQNLIATDEKDYILKASKIAKDVEILKKIRKDIFNLVISSPLFDVKKFTFHFFDSLEKIHFNR